MELRSRTLRLRNLAIANSGLRQLAATGDVPLERSGGLGFDLTPRIFGDRGELAVEVVHGGWPFRLPIDSEPSYQSGRRPGTAKGLRFIGQDDCGPRSSARELSAARCRTTDGAPLATPPGGGSLT